MTNLPFASGPIAVVISFTVAVLVDLPVSGGFCEGFGPSGGRRPHPHQHFDRVRGRVSPFREPALRALIRLGRLASSIQGAPRSPPLRRGIDHRAAAVRLAVLQ